MYVANVYVKSQTKVLYSQSRASLEEKFGAACALDSITYLQCCQWRVWLKDKGLAEATIAKRVKVARSVFRAGVKGGEARGPHQSGSNGRARVKKRGVGRRRRSGGRGTGRARYGSPRPCLLEARGVM
jgi:hypothetical protein